MQYAGFWRRFGALWLDFLIMSPVFVLVWWGLGNFRLFQVFYFLPGIAFGLFYSVYLVQRFGGTPGKRLMKIRILQVSGEPVGYKHASYRYGPGFVFGLMASLAMVSAVLSLSDAEYHSVASIQERQAMLNSARPVWGAYVDIILNLWVWSEFIVMMTNKKRRALHDFLAGTVVVRDAPITEEQTPSLTEA